MKLSHRLENQYWILSIDGILSYKGVGQFREYLTPLMEDKNIKGIILNMEKALDIDSSGIGVLMGIFKTLREPQSQPQSGFLSLKTFVFCELNEKCEYILKLVKLDKIVKMYSTEAEALTAQLKQEK